MHVVAHAAPPRLLLGAFAMQIVFGPAVVLLAPGSGWVPILLVFTAALSGYIVPPRTTVAIVGGNAVVAGAAAWLAGGGALEIGMTALLYLMLQALSATAVVIQQREEEGRRRLAEAHTELRATAALLADSSRATERLRIARDLHDVVGHQVTALALELEVASHRSTPPASTRVARARMIAKDLLTDMRATVGELRDGTTDPRAALEAVVTDLPRPEVHLRVADDVAVDGERLTALVRCVQEIVTNAIRHADATSLWIDVEVDEDGSTVLRARDDGRGARQLVQGNGLTGLRERMEALGGHARFSSDRGFQVVTMVPPP